MISCRYCKNFVSGDVIEIRTEGKNKVYVRYCRRKNKAVTRSDQACIRFRPANTFHCDRNNQRYCLAVCLHRRRVAIHRAGDLRNAFSACKRCRQFDTVHSVAKRAGVKVKTNHIKIARRVRNNEKPKAVIRRRVIGKPLNEKRTVIRRRKK